MISRRLLPTFTGCAFSALVLASCVHTPRGTSVEIALAKRADLVKYPATPTPAPGARPATGPGSAQPEKTEQIADAFSRGEFCMQAGKDAEAIAAFREVVRIDPKFNQAWTHLAALYERAGQEKLAMDAFRKSKTQPQ